MNTPSRGGSVALIALCVVAFVLAGLFAVLWMAERQVRPSTPPQVAPQTATVTVERTNTVEVVKEVPRQLTKEESRAVAFWSNFMAAPFLNKKNEALRDLESISVTVLLDDDLKKAVSEEQVRTKFELTLRKAGVPISEKAIHELSINIYGFLNKEGTAMSFAINTTLMEWVPIARKGRIFGNAFVASWSLKMVATCGRQKAEDYLLKNVEEQAEIFANDYLAANPPEKLQPAPVAP